MTRSEATKLKWQNPEYRNLIIMKLNSPEIKKKISEARKGQNAGEKHFFFGKKHTEETKRKIADAHRGKKRPKEIGEKISLSLIGLNAGPRHYKWTGLTPIIKQIRNCFKYRQWRTDIFIRDSFTCTSCGKRGGYLEAHHIPKSFNNILLENKIKTLEEAISCAIFWDIDNGITLCRECHDVTKRAFFPVKRGRDA